MRHWPLLAAIALVGCRAVQPTQPLTRTIPSPPMPSVARETMTVTLVRPQPNPNWTNPAPRIVNGVNYTPLAWDAGTNTGNPASNLVYIVQAMTAVNGSAAWRTIGVLPDLVCTVTSTNAQGYFRVFASNVVTHVESPR